MATVIEKDGTWAEELMKVCEKKGLIPVVMDKIGSFNLTNVSKPTKKTNKLKGLKYTVSAFLAEDGFNTENRIGAFQNALIIGFIKRDCASDAVIDIHEGREPKVNDQQTLP